MTSRHSKPTLFTALFFASMVSASVSCITVSGGGEALACAPAGGLPGMGSRPE